MMNTANPVRVEADQLRRRSSAGSPRDGVKLALARNRAAAKRDWRKELRG